MLRRLQLMLAGLLALSAAGSAVAVNDESTAVVTGLANTGPATMVFAIAAALLLTLAFRSTASQMMRSCIRRIGSRRVNRILSRQSNDILGDFLVPGAYGGLTRIDHAALTTAGILCIQTKHYSGLVYADAEEPQWTNIDGADRCKFLNPVIQNEGRMRALQKIVPEVPVAGVVVFTGNVRFASAPPKNAIRLRDLESYLAEFVSGPCKVDDWDAVWLTVKSAALTDEESRKDFHAQLSFS